MQNDCQLSCFLCKFNTLDIRNGRTKGIKFLINVHNEVSSTPIHAQWSIVNAHVCVCSRVLYTSNAVELGQLDTAITFYSASISYTVVCSDCTIRIPKNPSRLIERQANNGCISFTQTSQSDDVESTFWISTAQSRPKMFEMKVQIAMNEIHASFTSINAMLMPEIRNSENVAGSLT